MVEKIKRRRWKIILTVITLGALIVTAYALRAQILETIKNLKDANLGLVLTVVPLALLNHFAQGNLYRHVFKILGNRFRTKSMMRLSLEMNFVNNIFPSAGMSGFSYLTIRLRPEGISAGKATLVQIMRFALLFVSFQALLGIGLVLLALGDGVSNFVMLAAGSLATLLLVGTAVVVYIVSSASRLNAFFTGLTRVLNRLIKVVRPRHPETISIQSVEKVFTELHDNYKLLRRHLKELRRPINYAMLANFAEISSIYFVFLAFGQAINPGAIIIAYAVANFAGIISVLPGGIGVFEALMAGVFVAAGVPAGISLPVIISYRVISISTQIPIGYYFYQKNLQATES